jgi:hypothetical protein
MAVWTRRHPKKVARGLDLGFNFKRSSAPTALTRRRPGRRRRGRVEGRATALAATQSLPRRPGGVSPRWSICRPSDTGCPPLESQRLVSFQGGTAASGQAIRLERCDERHLSYSSASTDRPSTRSFRERLRLRRYTRVRRRGSRVGFLGRSGVPRSSPVSGGTLPPNEETQADSLAHSYNARAMCRRWAWTSGSTAGSWTPRLSRAAGQRHPARAPRSIAAVNPRIQTAVAVLRTSQLSRSRHANSRPSQRQVKRFA